MLSAVSAIQLLVKADIKIGCSIWEVWARFPLSLHQHQLLSKRLLVEHLVKRYLGATPSQTVHLPGELGVK